MGSWLYEIRADRRCFSLGTILKVPKPTNILSFQHYSSQNGEAALFDLEILFIKQPITSNPMIECFILILCLIHLFIWSFLHSLRAGPIHLCCSLLDYALEVLIQWLSYIFLQDSVSLSERHWSWIWEGFLPIPGIGAVMLTENFLLYTLFWRLSK